VVVLTEARFPLVGIDNRRIFVGGLWHERDRNLEDRPSAGLQHAHQLRHRRGIIRDMLQNVIAT
jgi:hypothetical protein